MNARPKILPASGLLVVVLLLAGCGSSSSGGASSSQSAATTSTASTASTASSSASGGARIGYAAPILAGTPDQEALVAGMKAAAKLLGWNVIPNDAHLSTSSQISALDTFTTEKLSGIATAVLDPHGEEPALKRVRQSGIPLIAILSSLPDANTDIGEQIYSTSCAAGKDAVAFISQRIPHARVLIVGGVAVPTIQLAANCFESAAKAAGLQVLGRQDNTQDNAAAAQTIAGDLLTKYPDVQAMWASNEDTAEGVYAALSGSGKSVYSASNKKGVILVAGCCGAPEGIQLIQQGHATAMYDGDSFEAGARAIAALALVVKDHKPASAMPRQITIPWARWDYSNVSRWQPLGQRSVSQYLSQG